MRASRVLVAAVAVAALVTGCQGDEEPVADADPAPTTPSRTAAATPPSAAPEPEDTATSSPTEEPGAEPSGTVEPSPPPGDGAIPDLGPPTPVGPPPSDAPALVGVVRATDPGDDVADSAGLPPAEDVGAVDLTVVELDGDGQRLSVAITVADPVPATASSLVWSLELWSGDTQTYSVTVQRIGARTLAAVLDWASLEQTPLPVAPSIDGATITFDVPAELLGRIDGPFQWQVLTQADGGYEDHLPSSGALSWFPTS